MNHLQPSSRVYKVIRLAEVTPSGYDLLHSPRVGRRGGGVGFLVDKGLNSSVLQIPVFDSFESILIQTVLPGTVHLNFATIYRPPSTSMPIFLREFGELLDLLQSFPVATMMAGDFNINAESKGYPSDGFHQLLSDKMLVQHVDFPTDLHDHVLDLIIAPEDLDIVAHVKRSECLTDHFAVTCILDVASITKPDKKTVSCRCYSKIVECNMRCDLLSSGLIKQPALDAVALYDQYHTTLCNLLDAHDPCQI